MEEQDTHAQKREYMIPGSIVVAGLLVAGAVVYSNGSGQLRADENAFVQSDDASTSASAKLMPDVRPDEHIRGDVNAPVSIVEYSDFECPYCSSFHPTLLKLLSEFDGDLKWVYRHFPLSTIHPRAFGASVAAECVATLTDENSFWQFTDSLFAKQSSLSYDDLFSSAATYGIDENAFNACLDDTSITDMIDTQRDDALAAGARGTPFFVIIDSAGERYPYSGAMPYEQLKAIVTRIIDQS